MAKQMKKVLSIILCLSLLMSFPSYSFASQYQGNGEKSYFDFEATEYEVNEDDGTIKINIVRQGDGNEEADVSFKVADFLSSYGDDYEVLGSDGKPLEKVYGEKPSVSELKYEGETEKLVNISDEADENEQSEEIKEGASDNESVSEAQIDESNLAENAAEENDAVDEDEVQSSENTVKKAKSTGSSLLDARNEYLKIEESEEDIETESAVKETIDDMYNYFLSAEGAAGVVHFKKGENKKSIVIKLIDNDKAEQNKIFMIALMGTDNNETMTAANATTYVTIVDDEDVEASEFELDEKTVTLTSDSPEGYVTVKRTGGTQYFANVYVSTVKATAAENSYEGFEYKTVSFVPGETEKKVKVKATDFSKDGNFGVRLEAENGVDIGNYYTTVKISAKESQKSESEKAALMGTNNLDFSNLSEELQSANPIWNLSGSTAGSKIVLGSLVSNMGISIPGGWKNDITGEGYVWTNDDGELCLENYDYNDYTMAVSNDKLNLIGIKNIYGDIYITNPSRGFDTYFDEYITYFETDSDQTFAGNLDGWSCEGNKDWTVATINLDNSGNSAYLKFAVRILSGGWDNAQARIRTIGYTYAKYTFSPQESDTTFTRKVYDFTQGTPLIYDTYYDGETSRIYKPGGIVIKKGEQEVSGFYGSNTQSVTISAKNETENTEKGIYLKGVYFTKGESLSNNAYYVAAKNGKVTVTPDQEFIKKLRNSGVVGNVHSDATIKVYPVFAQEQVKFQFENADRDDSNAATKGKFDADNRASYIVNVIEAAEAGTIKKQVYRSWLDYYIMYVPKYSIIRVQTQPISTRIANGVYWWSIGGSRTGTSYYKAGDTINSSTNPAGEVLTKTDYSKADIVADENKCIKPSTGAQTFDINYFPTEKEAVPDEYKGTDGLKNAVVTTDSFKASAISNSSEDLVGTDASGEYNFESPYIGMKWSLTAIAPNGYYTQWVNMTGDENEDGYISEEETSKLRNSGSMPDEVYGNRISGTLDQDNFKLNYYFLPKTLSGSGKKTGRVVKAPEDFYQLANNIKSNEDDIPVSAAYVDIGGFTGMTDGNGKYSISCNDLPAAGNVSTTVTAEGYEYNTISKLQKYTVIKLDALSKFNVKSLSANYAISKNAIADEFITVNDDELTIEATVSSDTAIHPTGARFFIYDNEGNKKLDIEEEGESEYYKTVCSTCGNSLTASLIFNPKKDMKFGYKIYVQFEDQNGEWTNKIDLGYYFYSKLNLAEFVFPLIGSSSLENVVRTGFVADLIGDPLGDLDLGTISGLEAESNSYTPSGINKDDAQNYTWLKTDYSFGFSDKFRGTSYSKSSDGASSEKSDKANLSAENSFAKSDEELKECLKAVYDGDVKGEEPTTKSKYSTNSSFVWNVTPTVGFNLTLSSRKDGKIYFEDLVFYTKVKFGVTASETIKLPIGISILIKGSLTGDVTGIYHMYVDYDDSYETEDAVEYTPESFGLFKKFNNSVRREGYIFIDPNISIYLGVGVGVAFVTGNASFSFDMDFQFTEDRTNAYGDVTIDLGWGIDVFNFQVYSNSLFNVTEKLFNTEGTDSHIDFDYKDNAQLLGVSISDYFSVDEDEELIMNKTTSREYLANRSEWLGDDDEGSLMSIDASDGTVEKRLLKGTTDNPNVKMTDIGNGNLLMVFIDDDISRTDANKRAVYYSIYSDGRWTAPELLDDDGTLDDYPNISDLDDGRLLVTWSSAENVLDDEATVEDALKSMNLKVAFFDKNTKKFSKAMQITKTTEGDYCADTMANAAYDKTSDRIILYYTKTEYDNLETVGDLSKAESVNAYMFYENGKWSDADSYTQTELSGMKDSETYKNDWYGQRFLDVRISKNYQPLVVDTTAISYNGLALFSWTADWDNNLETINDRDVFMQIYDFSTDKFTHIIRATSETGTYTTPKFARSDSATYLFYGENYSGSNSDEETKSLIKYINVSDLIGNGKYTKVQDGDAEYYVFKYTEDKYSSDADADSKQNAIGSRTVTAKADTAAKCDNLMDYDVTVTSDGQMYLLWTDTVDNSRQILIAAYNGTDRNCTEYEGNVAEKSNVSSEEFWSEPIIISNASENEFYSGIGAAAVKETVFAAGSKGNYNDKSKTTLVGLMHTPYSKVKATELEIMDESPQPLSTVTLNATVKNEGLKTKTASVTEPIIVNFTLNGEVIKDQEGQPITAKITKSIPGGTSVNVLCDVILPEDILNVEFAAYIDDEADKVSTKLELNQKVELTESQIKIIPADGYDNEKVMYSGILENTGNVDVKNITFTATVGDKQVGSLTIANLAANETQDAEIELSISDSEYELGKDGMGTAKVELKAVSNKETIASYSGTVKKEFSEEALELISKVKSVRFNNDGKYTIKLNDKKDIQPTINGVDEDELMVLWTESSNEKVAYSNYDNLIVGASEGSTEFTGIVVPNQEIISFNGDNASETDWQKLIPSDKLITVKMTVNVVKDGEISNKGSGSKEEYCTVTYNYNNGEKSNSIKVEQCDTVSELPVPVKDGYEFCGWYTDSECSDNAKFTKDTKVNSNIQLYAKWTAKEMTSEMPFKDVTVKDWFYNDVKDMYENGLMNGMNETEFAPGYTLTRAMTAVILYRMSGEPEVQVEDSVFTDVEKNSWYTDAVKWAAKNGIVKGVTETEFAPNNNITREQFATMLYRYIGTKFDLSEEDLKDVSIKSNDAKDVSDWAENGVKFCYSKGIMTGDDKNNLNPKKDITRAECAAMINRTIKETRGQETRGQVPVS